MGTCGICKLNVPKLNSLTEWKSVGVHLDFGQGVCDECYGPIVHEVERMVMDMIKNGMYAHQERLAAEPGPMERLWT